MKLFVDCHVFDGIPQGSRTYIEGIYKELIKRNPPNLTLYLGAFDIESLKQVFGEHPNVVYVKYRSKNKIIRLAIDIPKIIRRYKIDYAHYQYMLPLRKCCKEIVTIHDVLFLDFPKYFSLKFRVLYNFLFRIAAHRAEILLTVSKYSQEKISQHYRVDPQRIYITPNAVDTSFPAVADDAEATKHDRFILYVSRIEERKNHLGLVKAFVQSNLWKKGVRLIMAGYVTQRVKKLDEYIASLPPQVASNIIFCTPDNQTREQLFRGCDLFVYPSVAEGFGIPPLEAAMRLRPVLCSDTTAMQDFSDLGFTMFDPSDTDCFASLLLDCMQTQPSLEKRQEIAQRIVQRYNWTIGADLLIELLHL